MKIINRQPDQTADISAERNTSFRELSQLIVLALITLLGLYLVVGFAVDYGVKKISYEREAQIFGAMNLSSVLIAEESEVDAERLAVVQGVLDKLREHPDVPDITYHIIVLNQQDANAFAFPGGTIGVTSGLLDLVDDDIELAFVIGHELGHFYNRDHLHGLGRAIGLGVGYMLIFGGQMSGDSLTPIFMSVIQGAYSRQQESKADRFGLKIVFDQYGTTEGFDRLFQFLKEQEETPKWVKMFSTHPAPEDRIEILTELASELEVKQ